MGLIMDVLILSRGMSISYRNQSIDLLCKSLDWFQYDRYLRHERVKPGFTTYNYSNERLINLYLKRHIFEHSAWFAFEYVFIMSITYKIWQSDLNFIFLQSCFAIKIFSDYFCKLLFLQIICTSCFAMNIFQIIPLSYKIRIILVYYQSIF